MQEVRVYGPPGVGKTTWLAKQIDRARSKYFSSEIMVCSFTRGAAEELRSRDLSIPQKSVGTLHSHCYNLLGCPTIAETKAGEFNEEYPHYAINQSRTDAIDDGALPSEYNGAEKGDELLARYSLERNKMSSRTIWPQSLTGFATAWERWKADSGYFDFTDLIEHSLNTVPEYEGKHVALIDEAQDLTPLQLALVRQWGENMDTFVMVGDDDQAIYGFAGASPEAFLSREFPPSHEIILGESHRVPRKVQVAAQKWIAGVKHRKEKEYKPRDFEGELVEYPGTFKSPSGILNDAEKYLEAGKTVMFLAPCSYQLTPIIAELRKRGWPFHNPYRRIRSDWNPLRPGKGTSTSERLIAYLEPCLPLNEWSPEQIQAWGVMIKADAIFNKGIKGKLGKMSWPPVQRPDASSDDWNNFYKQLETIFKPGGYEQAHKLDLDWLIDHVSPEYAKRIDFPARIYRDSGILALKNNPQIIVGTIHSVKGGQSDVTYLCPDISTEAYKAASASAAEYRFFERDDIIRQFYVGMTRCRETLVITRPSTRFTAQQIRRM